MRRLRFLVIWVALAAFVSVRRRWRPIRGRPTLRPCRETGSPADAGPQLRRGGQGDRRGGRGHGRAEGLSGLSERPGALACRTRYDEAAAVFDAMQKDFPKSDWLRRARFAKATALARKGDFRAAEVIVRAEAEYLLSTDRKQQIADIYLEFADALFKPAKDDVKPDYAKAFEFYQEGARCRAEAGEADRGGTADGPVPAEFGEVSRRRLRSTRSSSRIIRRGL